MCGKLGNKSNIDLLGASSTLCAPIFTMIGTDGVLATQHFGTYFKCCHKNLKCCLTFRNPGIATKDDKLGF